MAFRRDTPIQRAGTDDKGDCRPPRIAFSVSYMHSDGESMDESRVADERKADRLTQAP